MDTSEEFAPTTEPRGEADSASSSRVGEPAGPVRAIEKALWYIESHSRKPITLDDIAGAAGVSRFALCRSFGVATGCSVMRYVRARKLTEAARELASGASDILHLALDWGYGSHEAFTRAFRDQFGMTPEAVRAQRHVTHLSLMEPIRMESLPSVTLETPRLEMHSALLAAGLSERYTYETCHTIPMLWQKFLPHFGYVPGQVGQKAYGVVYNMDEAGNMDYMAAVEVSSFDRLPEEFNRLRIAEHYYAIFPHRGHISTIRGTFHAIFSQWLPNSGYQLADAPELEVYGEDFDGHKGTGTVEIWIPIHP